jgi:PmbA protein
MERDYWYTSARHLSDLMDPETVGSIAAQRTLRRLGATQPTTASVPVIYENTVASRLLGSLAGAICGGSVYRQLSYLAGKLGERIASDKVSIRDDPHILRGASSREFDGEGLATRPLDVVTNGILDAYLLDTYSAKKLGMASTRSASRGLGSTPSASPSNFWMAPGNQSLEELIGDVKNGVLITELMGFGTNTVTGDYSQGASGVWIENGKLTRPVNEMTVASTLQQMWCGIDGVANDLDRRKGLSAPSFRINQMTVGGA